MMRSAVARSACVLNGLNPKPAEMETKPTKAEILRMVELEFLFLRSP